MQGRFVPPDSDSGVNELAERIYFQNGLARRAALSAFWPLFFVRLVTDLELSPLQLVLLGTVMELSILIAEVPTGVVADLYSRKWSVILAFVIGGPAILASAFVENYIVMVVVQSIIGVAATFESGAETAWISDEVGSSERAEPLILRRASWQLGAAILGIVLFAGLAAVATLTTSLAILGAAFTVYGLSLIARMPETAFVRNEDGGWSGFSNMMRSGWAVSTSARPLRILLLVIFISGLAKEAIDRLDVQRLVDVGLPADTNEALLIGIIVAIRSLFAAGALWVARRRGTGRSVVVAVASLFVGVAVGVAVLAHVEVLWIAALGLVFQGGLHLATTPLATTWTNTFAPSASRATVHSFIGQAEAFGEILGGIALGVVAEVLTVPTAMTLSAALFGVAAVVALRARSVWDVAKSY